MKYDVVIVGAGLGGLECGLMLQRCGKRVLVLESGALLGGCLQTFRRRGQHYDTGFHYVGGLEEGQMLGRLFSYFGLMDLPWVKMDPDCFDEVIVGGESFAFANGYDGFFETLAKRFPAEREGLAKYVEMLKKVGDNIVNSLEPRNEVDVYQNSLFAQSAYEFLTSNIKDPLLIDVLSGASLKMELNPDKLPLYVFAQINSIFVQSAYRLAGGGMQIAERLAEQIEELGGKVLRNSRVTAFEGEDGKAKAVIVNDGEARYEADVFISNMHPANTASILQQAGLVRKIFAKRMTSLENTFGMLTVNIGLKPGMIEYKNRNQFIYSQPGVWNLHSDLGNGVKAIMISYAPPTDGSKFASNIDILTPMRWDDVQQWFGTKVGSRGSEYVALKERVADECVEMAAKHIHGLREAIADRWISTPLTYADYTGTAQGSAYGIRKDYNATMYTVLTPKTPVPNVFLTGQSLNLHGILGTSMTALFTCAEIIGMDAVANQLKLRH